VPTHARGRHGVKFFSFGKQCCGAASFFMQLRFYAKNSNFICTSCCGNVSAALVPSQHQVPIYLSKKCADSKIGQYNWHPYTAPSQHHVPTHARGRHGVKFFSFGKQCCGAASFFMQLRFYAKN
jgi:hypothetical protein